MENIIQVTYYEDVKILKSNQFQLLILLIFINGQLPKDEIDSILKFERLKWYITSWVTKLNFTQ